MGHLAVTGGTPVRQRAFSPWPIWNEEEIEAVTAVIESGRWGALDGTEVSGFESEFAAYQDAAYGIAVVNGTVALKLGLMACGIGLGDEVIVPAYTFVATATAVLEIGAVPVFADIDPNTYTLDPAHVAACITPRTRAIVPVHLGGRPADMDALLALAQRHHLAIVEDAAQSWGSAWKHTRVGALGQIGGFSFQSSKNITAGEGGILLCNDPGMSDMARALSNSGRRTDGVWYAHYVLGGNYRLSELQGAILRVQLRRYPQQMARRQNNAAYFEQACNAIDGLTPLVQDSRITSNAYHLLFLRYDAAAFSGAPKTRFVAALQAEGIGATVGYSLPVHRQPVLLDKQFGLSTPPLFQAIHPDPPDYSKVTLPVTERACMTEAVWLKQNMLLGERKDIDDIVEAIMKIQRYSHELQSR